MDDDTNAGGAPVIVALATRLDPESDVTARVAVRLAERIGAELLVVHVAEALDTAHEIAASAGMDQATVRERMLRETEERVREFIGRSSPSVSTRVRIGEGRAVDEIVRIADDEGADYLVVGTEDRGRVHELVVGGTTREILRNANCPVVVVRLPARGSED